VIYVSGAWVIIELVEYLIEHFSVNEQARVITLIILLCGMPIAIFLAWHINREKETDQALPDGKSGSVKIPRKKKPTGRFARMLRRPEIMAPGTVLMLLLIVAGIRYFNRQAKIRWAYEKALPEIEHYGNEMNMAAAFQLAQKAEKYIPKDPKLKELSSMVSTKYTILTGPPGVDIYYKEYADLEGDWSFLGVTPIDSIRLPAYIFCRWKMEKTGYETVLAAATPAWPDSHDTLYRTLHKTGEIPPGMVYVEGGNYLPHRQGFFIDRYEVSNKQFKEFSDNGGYQNPDFWKHKFIKDGNTLSWEEAMKYFKDATGRFGPATWQVGDYPDNKGDYPVSGISWYEAAAYAEYAGKNLPTNADWMKAAGYTTFTYSYFAGSNVVPVSNFRGDGPEPIGSTQAISYFGVCDIIGNVREWCWNKAPDGRIIRGGAWNDITYMSKNVSQTAAFNRSPKNGFRCLIYLEKDQIPDQLFEPISFNASRDLYNEEPVSETEYKIFKNQFLYDKTALNAEMHQSDKTDEDWIVEKVSFDAAYENDQMIAYLFLPKNSIPPYQTVIHFPGGYARGETDLTNSYNTKWQLKFIVKSGRAAIYPVYKGTYERNDGQYRDVQSNTHTYTEYLIKLVKDLSRTIDYLDTRPDIDTAKLAYHGESWGGWMGGIIPAVEERLKVSILLLGGLSTMKRLPEADPLNYVSRVKIPVLMLNGEFDFIFPLETNVRHMFDLLGTPEEHKVLKIYETDHYLPRNEVIKETLDWLDKYFGPVKK
jgi:formylglycine-generating enzyme required for sulfatase activity/cephalosporin-C deacetylase-like acetyl esterase